MYKNKKKIMVIDDEEDFLQIVKMNLEETDKYEVITFTDAKDILEKLRHANPDIILLDLIMGEVGGEEVCKILSKDYGAKKIPVIIITALDEETDKRRLKKLGIAEYVTKPVEIKSLITKVEKILNA